MADPLVLGPFELTHPIGRGGMGRVWAGHHRVLHLPVAVKVLVGDVAKDLRFRGAFRSEMAVLAALDHPNIVRVLDCGVIPVSVAEADDLVAGSPWLAMELAPRGSVRGARVMTWREVLRIAVAVLDALAHAHARGVLHRDVKPANILYVGAAGRRLALSDFGIARMGDLPVMGVQRGGTPGYAAPEQAQGRFDREGPWTDLYALGRSVNRLVTGEAAGDVPLFPVPDRYEEWLARMVARDPDERYPTAAHAAFALATLGDPAASVAARIRIQDVETLEWLFEPGEEPASIGLDLAEVADPPLAPWPKRPAIEVLRPLMGVGLGLFSQRVSRLCGRHELLRRIWSHVVGAFRASEPRHVVLHGVPGVGRTRLGQEVAWRLLETGAGSVVHSAAEARDRDGFVLVWLDDVLGAAVDAASVHGGRRLVLWTSGEAVDGAVNIEVDELAPEAHRRLVHDQLGLDPSLAVRVESRSSGNPGYALSMLSELVGTRQLEEGPRGFRYAGQLRAPSAELLALLDSALDGVDRDARRVLEVAAFLGPTFDHEVWAAAASELGLGPIEAAAELVATRKLMAREGDTWRFRSSALPELLRERVSDPACIHLACAAALPNGREVAHLRGRHLLGAGRDREAIDVLLAAASEANHVRSDHLQALALVEDARAAMRRLDVPLTHPDWGPLRTQHAVILGYLSTQLAAEVLQDVYRDAERYDWPGRASTARHCARLQMLAARYDEALAWSEVAIAVAGTERELATARVTCAMAQAKLGRLDVAGATLEEAVHQFHALGLVDHEIWAGLKLSNTRRMAGDLVSAEGFFEHCRGLHEAQTESTWDTVLMVTEAELRRLSGDLDGAERQYTEAIRRLESSGDSDHLTVRLNLAMVDLARGAAAKARDIAVEVGAVMRLRGPMEAAVTAWGIEAAAAAELDDWGGVHRALLSWRHGLRQSGLVNDDIGHLSEGIARRARDAGRTHIAGRAAQLAVSVWTRLGRDADASRAETLTRPSTAD